MQCDVLIVGGGPAGSTLARQLALAGIDVLVVDKKAFPRDKPCGEFLSPECQPYLEGLGLGSLLSDLGAQRVQGMRICGKGLVAAGRFASLPQRGDRSAGFGIRRARFDDALLTAAQAAGARVQTRCEFVNLRRGAADRVVGADLRTSDGAPIEVAARWVVGADGVFSRVAKDLDVQRPLRWLQQVALTSHFAGVPAAPTAEVHLLHSGFFAAVTVDDGIFSVNLVLPRERYRSRRTADWDEFVMQHAADTDPEFAARLALAKRLAPWKGIGPLAHTTTRVSVPGAVLVGDAAGYVDPLTGEGIYFALFGARALGDALLEALATPRDADRALRGYARRRHRELAPRLFLAKVLQRGLRHPFVVSTFLRGLARWPRLADLLVTMSGDSIHPRELWRPGFWRQFRRAA
ncbi:MAG: NAD(P)/FAD-dependent oxidoreductase [Planctomycetes bacterium]|nr:NAD(P)/FAD-dependent oxidoreductase [Planctomycetota bacterium]